MTERHRNLVSIGVIVVVALNMLLMVYHYGQVTQKLDDLSGRVTRIERILDDRWAQPGSGIQNLLPQQPQYSKR